MEYCSRIIQILVPETLQHRETDPPFFQGTHLLRKELVLSVTLLGGAGRVLPRMASTGHRPQEPRGRLLRCVAAVTAEVGVDGDGVARRARGGHGDGALRRAGGEGGGAGQRGPVGPHGSAAQAARPAAATILEADIVIKGFYMANIQRPYNNKRQNNLYSVVQIFFPLFEIPASFLPSKIASPCTANWP